jgi:hypothetical protein
MDFVLGKISQFLREYVREISVALVATILALYGGYINDGVKSLMKNHHFLFRFMVFVLLCAFGYGAISVYAAHFVRLLLLQLSDLWLAPIIVLCFLIIGLLAERKRKI